MLLGGNTGKGLKPVGKVGCPMGHRPIPHSGGHRVGHANIQPRVLINGPAKRLVHFGGQIRFHHPIIKYQTSEILWQCCHVRSPFPRSSHKKGKGAFREYSLKTPLPLWGHYTPSPGPCQSFFRDFRNLGRNTGKFRCREKFFRNFPRWAFLFPEPIPPVQDWCSH